MGNIGELSGRVALVTGGSKGIGKSIAQSLAREGANVVILGRTGALLESAAQELSGLEGCVGTVVADVTDPTAVQHAVETVVQRFNQLDILINNAGGTNRVAGFSELTREDWFDAFELNLMSVVYFVQSALPWLKQSKGGRIVNISSISGVEPGLLIPNYCAAKAAVINLGKHLANLFARDGILVNTICPGQVRSDARNDLAAYVASKNRISLSTAITEINTKGADNIPLGRIGEPDDVAGLVTFLVSDKAAWITGACFHVNGGKHRSAF